MPTITQTPVGVLDARAPSLTGSVRREGFGNGFAIGHPSHPISAHIANLEVRSTHGPVRAKILKQLALARFSLL
jgi:hypothetical protein